MNKEITVVFLMGGKAQRFGNKFKPFLKIFDKTFLELAIQPFLKHKDSIKEMIFLTTEEQCAEFSIQAKIKSFNLPISWMIYSTATANGIIADINKLIGDRSGLNDVIFCDCDHSLNVDELFSDIKEDKYEVILPGWEINKEESHKWSIMETYPKYIYSIKEKEYPASAQGTKPYGVIGCYYFKHFKKVSPDKKYISDIISELLETVPLKAKSVIITKAEFFGDPERLRQLYEEKRASTVFCDIDGTIIEHESEPDFTKITLLHGAKEKIQQWRDENCFIVLTTSRDEQFRPEMEKLLRDAGIRWESLVMGLPPGTRHLINDKKPYADSPMAVAHEVNRNEGICNLDLGNSFASLELKDKIVFKTISEDSSTYQVKKLESQFKSMRSVFREPETSHLVPKIYDFSGYSYGMEYLDGYVGLHKIADKVPVLKQLFKDLPKLYANRFKADNDWLQNYIEEKIYSKKQVIADLGLDASEIYERLEALTVDEYELLSPIYLYPIIHGDLTYENIMCKGKDIKLLDFDNDGLSGPAEQDLGKLYQSAYAQYEHWGASIDSPCETTECETMIKFFAELFNQDEEHVHNKAIFYCGLHLIRMLPYQAKTSIERTKKALKYAKELLLNERHRG